MPSFACQNQSSTNFYDKRIALIFRSWFVRVFALLLTCVLNSTPDGHAVAEVERRMPVARQWTAVIFHHAAKARGMLGSLVLRRLIRVLELQRPPQCRRGCAQSRVLNLVLAVLLYFELLCREAVLCLCGSIAAV
jgi:hypothetical protein